MAEGMTVKMYDDLEAKVIEAKQRLDKRDFEGLKYVLTMAIKIIEYAQAKPRNQ